MEKEKAYKLLAAQENISNKEAKSLIDRGLVYVGAKKLMIARGNIGVKTVFKIQKIEKAKIIFENDDLIVVDKPAFINSDEIVRQFGKVKLLHRLDRETSGVLMLVKNEEFQEKAIQEFKRDRVYKEYTAWVDGLVAEGFEINKPIVTNKRGNKAYSKVDNFGKPACTEVFVEAISGKKSKLKCIIHNGRTHQIRVHLQSAGLHIIGDEQYGGRRYSRVMLHARKVTLLGLTFEAKEPALFKHFEA